MALPFVVSCSSDDKESAVKKVGAVNIPEFKAYKGDPGGAIEIEFNNLRKIDLVSQYFGNDKIRLFINRSIEFNGDKLTYIYSEKESDRDADKRIVSNYEFRNDSLFIIKSDGTPLFVAKGSNQDDLSLTKGFALYPRPVTKKDTLHVFNVALTTDTILELAGFSNLNEVTSKSDTIIWCNVNYRFE